MMEKTKKKQYRRFLYICLTLSIITLNVTGYLYCYSMIPSNIKIRAGMEQTLDFGIPVTGEFSKVEDFPEVVAVSEQPASNIPRESINMDLNQSVTLRADQLQQYRLQLKLFGVIPLKQVDVEVIEDEKLIPAGIPIGIYVKTRGVLVIGVGDFQGADGTSCSPSRYLIKSGDYILKADGEEVEGKAWFMNKVEASNGAEMILTLQREEQVFDLKVVPQKNESGEYKLGVWIRDNAQGVGTLTYMEEDGGFGALGHGINDVDTSTLLNLEAGSLYHTDIIAIRKGVSGEPGEMTGMIEYSDEQILGMIEANTQEGIFGMANEHLTGQLKESALPIALKQEIQMGYAQILCTVDGHTQYYDIEITDLHLDNDNINRGIVLRITDSGLLESTGGIIQGMSGAPIVQNGRIIGAVTHVLVQDATRGYGIFIESMLSHETE